MKSDATRLNPLAVGGAGCAAAPPDPDISLKDALKRAKFWHVFLILMFCAAGLFTIIIHHVAYLTDMGFTTAFASSLFALIGILLIPSHILIGELSDRYGRETAFTAMTLCLVLSAAVLVSIAPSSPVWLIYFFPVLFGLGYGGVSPLFPAISSDIFASRNIGKIYGMHSLGFNIGSSMGPWIAGKLFDLWGSYFVPFSFSMVAFALADFFVWKAAPRKHKKKAQPETR